MLLKYQPIYNLFERYNNDLCSLEPQVKYYLIHEKKRQRFIMFKARVY